MKKAMLFESLGQMFWRNMGGVNMHIASKVATVAKTTKKRINSSTIRIISDYVSTPQNIEETTRE